MVGVDEDFGDPGPLIPGTTNEGMIEPV